MLTALARCPTERDDVTPLEKADRAKNLLGDPIFLAVMQDIRLGLVAKLETTAMDDHGTHHEVAVHLQLLRQIPILLQRYADELEVERQRQEHDSWVKRARERIVSWR